MSKTFTVYAPASTANIGPGFDTFGCALNLYLSIKVKVDTTQTNSTTIKSIDKKTDCHLFVFQCIYYFYQRLVLQIKQEQAKQNSFDKNIDPISIPIQFSLYLKNEIPIASGLGSSAACIVASAIICNELFCLGLSKNQLFKYSLELESHPDNIGPSLFGSLFVPIPNDDNSYDFSLVKINPDIKFLCMVPDIQLSTTFSRNILPETYQLQDVVYNIQHSSSLLISLMSPTLNVNMISKSLKDKIHQPFRIPYIPGLDHVLDTVTSSNTPGLLGIVISGSGPSILALCYGNFTDINNKISSILLQHNLTCKSILLNPDYLGANVIYDD